MKNYEFRSWDKKKKMMFDWRETLQSILGVGTGHSNNLFENETVELMQYTGLVDKNGKKIFEGDILHVSSYTDKNKIGVVRLKEYNDGESYYDDVHYGYIVENGQDRETLPDSIRAGNTVIANIYENPDLIKEDK